MIYNWELLPRLALAIEHAQRSQTRRDLRELMTILYRDCDKDLTLFKMRCAQTMSACIRGALRGGAPSEVIYREHMAFLRVLSRLRSYLAVKQRMQRYAARLVSQVEPVKRSPGERIVAGIVKDLKAMLHDSKSLAQYADELGLSTGHLSRTFNRVAGRPFRNVVRRLRCEEACQLLESSDLKLSAVALRIGLRSTSQFIADFRREKGVTPAMYRRRAVRALDF
jgi:AraC-like DNA-binding protein